jgi:hypothetical protein
MPMGPGMMGKRLSLAFAVVGQSAVRVATAGREWIAVGALVNRRGCSIFWPPMRRRGHKGLSIVPYGDRRS